MKQKKIVAFLMITCILFTAGCQSNAGKEESADKQDVQEKQDRNITADDDAAQTQVQASEHTEMIVEENTESDSNEQTQKLSETYTWNEITVTIPTGWKDKYIILEDEGGFYFYQKASYEKEEYMGFLCGFAKSDEFWNYGAGETLIAYTEEGSFYYMTQPTDVTFDVESETAATEYLEMEEEIERMKLSLQISGDGIRYDEEQFVFPNSSFQELDEDLLMNTGNNYLWIARNEIYARHGRIFKNEYLQSYFNSCSWYQAVDGKTEVADSELNEIERANLEKIVSAERAFDDAHPYPVQYETGTSVLEPIAGNGLLQEVVYEVKEKNEYEYDYILTIDGTAYDLGEYIYMTTPVTDVFYVTDLAEYESVSEYDDGLEIAVLDEGPSNDPMTHFFKYDGDLKYIGEISGFPFAEENNGIDGFTHYNGVNGRIRTDLIETAFANGYWWYDSSEWKLEYMDLGVHEYLWRDVHELFTDLPVYLSMDENSPKTTIKAQKEVYFIETDLKEWILVRGKDGSSGYIRVKDGKVLNVNEPAENVFSDLSFFD